MSSTLDNGAFAKELNRTISAIRRSAARQQFDPNMLARNWGINRETARRTANATTQRGVRTLLHPFTRHCLGDSERTIVN